MNIVRHGRRYDLARYERRRELALHQRMFMGYGSGVILAPSFRSAASATTESAQNLLVSVPAGTADGDAMLIFGHFVGPFLAVADPSGWTAVGSVGNGVDLVMYCWRRVAASEPTDYTVTGWGGANSGMIALAMLSFTGVFAANFVDISGSEQETVSGTSYASPSVTTTVNNTMIVAAVGLDSSPGYTPPGGMDERVDANSRATPSNAGISITVATAVQAAAGASGTKTFTAGSTNGLGCSWTVAIKRSS